MQISKSEKKVSENFKMKEFYSGSPDAPESHFLDERLIKIAQELRSHFGEPVIVNSTFRTKSHNFAVGGASKSFHLDGLAMDLKFTPEVHEKIISGIELERSFYIKLMSLGLRGVGFYDSFIHFDVRNTRSLAKWDYRVKKKGSLQIKNILKGENRRFLWLGLPVVLIIYKIFKK